METNYFDFIAKLKDGQIIKLLPNYQNDGSRGSDIVSVDSLFITNKDYKLTGSGEKGRLYYDSFEKPILSESIIRSELGKKINRRYFCYGIVDGEYKIIGVGEILRKIIITYKLHHPKDNPFEPEKDKALLIKVNGTHIPDYKHSQIIDKKIDFKVEDLFESFNVLEEYEELKKWMIKTRPISIEELIEKNAVINSPKCFNYLSESSQKVREFLTPLFRKNRIQNLFDNDNDTEDE